jgi:hypothetical protein
VESLSALAQSPLFSKLSIVIAGLILVGLFWWRAGSIHIILDRIWRLIAGKTEVHDSVLKSLLVESRDVEKFVFFYRLKVETMEEIHKLATWMRKHSIGIARLQKMRPWVDVNSPQIVLQPPARYVLHRFLIALLTMGATAVISPAPFVHEAFLQMRASTVWFKTDAVSVQAIWGGWKFNRLQCLADRSAVAKLTGFNIGETNSICDALNNDGLKPLVEQTVTIQKWIGIAFVLSAFAVGLHNLFAAISAQEAVNLRKKIDLVGDGSDREQRHAASHDSPSTASMSEPALPTSLPASKPRARTRKKVLPEQVVD